MEKCEKIPAAHRRLLLKNGENGQNKNRKIALDTNLSVAKNVQTWKHSRYFVERMNEAINEDGAMNNMITGLNELRKELKIISNAHTGVKRTPKKTLRCHICNEKFINCVEYALHTANHASNPN